MTTHNGSARASFEERVQEREALFLQELETVEAENTRLKTELAAAGVKHQQELEALEDALIARLDVMFDRFKSALNPATTP